MNIVNADVNGCATNFWSFHICSTLYVTYNSQVWYLAWLGTYQGVGEHFATLVSMFRLLGNVECPSQSNSWYVLRCRKDPPASLVDSKLIRVISSTFQQVYNIEKVWSDQDKMLENAVSFGATKKGWVLNTDSHITKENIPIRIAHDSKHCMFKETCIITFWDTGMVSKWRISWE